MKQWLFSCSVVFCLLWLCAPSAWADGAEPEFQQRCREALPNAIASLKAPERPFIVSDGSNPNGAILLPQAVTMLWRLMGCPKVELELPFYADKTRYYYPALLWAYREDLLDALGYVPEKAEEFAKTFEEKQLYNKDVVRLLYKLEISRLNGKAPELPELPEGVTLTDGALLQPYQDVWRTADDKNNAYLVQALLWAGDASRNFISGILGETIENAVYFRPCQEKIGSGICARGQFFVLLYLYAQYMEKTGNPEQKAA